MGTPGLNLPWDSDDDGATAVPLVTVTSGIGRGTNRLGRLLSRVRVAPWLLRTLSVVCSVAALPVAAYRDGAPAVAAGLVLVAGVAGTLDGPVAASTGRLTRLGVVYDPVTDRVCEVCWLAVLWLLGGPAGAVVATGVLTGVFEYIRARAVLVGMSGRGVATIGGRGVRVAVVVLGLTAAGLGGLTSTDLVAGIATVTVFVWAALAFVGLIRLVSTVRDTLA
ncbi:CDP-alcohol phosphatidyltransferase family protein [Luedemannella helvata]|uniref:CDP-alcohol phosphatidyltransferase family protein n=1 Tax=Luedemannella helvata TaxID=349315 RepID=A0ABP4W0C7_9ACTN